MQSEAHAPIESPAAARLPVLDRRRAGVLLHLTSLTADGRASLGAAARTFIDWLVEAQFSIWQILPIGPPGEGGSPYWLRSDHAGDAAQIDPRELPLPREALERPNAIERMVSELLRAAPSPLHGEYEIFLERSSRWLDDYAFYEALRATQGGRPWTEWPVELRDRDPRALEQARHALAPDFDRVRVLQFLFDRQWRSLRAYAHERGVRLFGDLPIYVAPDSVETWAHREQFQLGADGRPVAVAGVPPDYFSEDGQLWGNPLYEWNRMRADGFAHWRARVASQLERFDLLRIDHFRGLAGYWAVPAGAPNARNGRWHKAAGRALFRALRAELGDLPFVAEDLGVITPDVEQLRDGFGLPGMRVLQFGFDGEPENAHLPHNLVPNTVVYTGTHDNDTSLGWYLQLDAESLRRTDFYLEARPGEMPRPFVRAALASVARLAVIPMQDLLGLGSEARLNTPGTTAGNWSWRLPPGALAAPLAERMRLLNRAFGRA
jgi:4-alpha-glucanotransferase